MWRSTLLAAALAALATAVPATPSTPTAPCPPSYEEHMRNASTVFGWQLAGASKDTDELDATCSGLKDGAYTKWANQGLVINKIAAPMCNTSTSPDAQLALPNIVQYNTNVYATLLLNSFDASDTTVWNYLCNNLRFKQISNFLLNSQILVNSTCNAGSGKINPQPFVAIGGNNATAVADYQQAASKLFAWEYASSASSSAQLNTMCAHAGASAAKWENLQLDPQSVEETICSFQTPLAVADVKAKMKEWMSKQYVTVLENMSNAPGYQKWLCHKLQAETMSEAGLDGKYVKEQICQNGSSKLELEV